MEYIYNMSTYQKLHAKYPNNVMLQICVDRYEFYLECYMLTGNYKFKASMNIIHLLSRIIHQSRGGYGYTIKIYKYKNKIQK